MTESVAGAHESHRLRLRLGRAMVYLLLFAGSVFMALPFYWMVSSSLKNSQEVLMFPPTWVPSLDRAVWQGGELTLDGRAAVAEIRDTLGAHEVSQIAITGLHDEPELPPEEGDEPGLVRTRGHERAQSVMRQLDAGRQLNLRRMLRQDTLTIGGRRTDAPGEGSATAHRVEIEATTGGDDSQILRFTVSGDLFGEEMGLVRRTATAVGQIFTARYWTGQLQWGNYPNAWVMRVQENAPAAQPNFTRYFFNSAFVATVVTAGALLTSALAAYALATMNFIGAGVYFFLIIGTLYIPGQILLIPNYAFFSRLGDIPGIGPHIGLNTYFVLVFPWFASVFAIFLLRQAFMTLPRDLFHAALIDGSSRLRYLFAVAIPLSKPTLITAGIFSFLATWNSLLWPLVMVSGNENLYTVELGLSRFRSEAGNNFELLMAASTFSITPVVILFFFLQRYFIAGIARSGLK